jgi:hypothetical protein
MRAARTKGVAPASLTNSALSPSPEVHFVSAIALRSARDRRHEMA